MSPLFLLLHLMDVTTERAIDKSLQKCERFVLPLHLSPTPGLEYFKGLNQ